LFPIDFPAGCFPPRSNYDSFLWAFVTTFQVMSGENWNAVMYDAIARTGVVWGVSYFVLCVCIGTYIILNLVLAILIDKFTTEETKDGGGGGGGGGGQRNAVTARAKERLAREEEEEARKAEEERRLRELDARDGSRHRETPQGKRGSVHRQLTRSGSSTHVDSLSHRSCFLFSDGSAVRRACLRVVVHPRFETFLLAMIGMSCVTIALDEPGAGGAGPQGNLKRTLGVLDLLFTGAFALEVLLKVVAFGAFAHPGAYLRNRWNGLDFVISASSVASLFLAGSGVDLASLKALRSLRALRPLRMIRRMPGLKIVIDSLFKALPPCFNVALILVLFFLVFAILGFNFFKGTLGSCNDCTRGCAPGKGCALPCAGLYNATTDDGLLRLNVPRVWANPHFGSSLAPGSDISFDDVFSSMVLFFEVSTLEMWLDIMYAAVDGTQPGFAPRRDAKPEVAFVFILFIVLLNFFMLNVFVSVVIDNFNRIKNAGENIFITSEQRAWIEMQKNLDLISEIEGSGPKQLNTLAYESETRGGGSRGCWGGCCRWLVRRAFRVVVGTRFEGTIMALIMTNILAMCCSYEGEPPAHSAALEALNLVFLGCFWLEALLKLLAFGPSAYIECYWNRFDFALLALDTAVLVLELALSSGGGGGGGGGGSSSSGIGVDLTLLRVVRIARVFRLVKKMPGLKALFRTLYYSLPSLFNVGAIMFMLVYVYAAVGMNLFGGICYDGSLGYVCENINENANFDSMATALVTLFRMLTGESWNAIAHDCAQRTGQMAMAYFMSFVMFGQVSGSESESGGGGGGGEAAGVCRGRLVVVVVVVVAAAAAALCCCCWLLLSPN
jgi:hypothetical protein